MSSGPFVPGSRLHSSNQSPEAQHPPKKEIQKNSTYVGNEFVSQVRSMKEGKTKQKPIHGQGTNKEIQELRDEGIDIVNIPWISDDH